MYLLPETKSYRVRGMTQQENLLVDSADSLNGTVNSFCAGGLVLDMFDE